MAKKATSALKASAASLTALLLGGSVLAGTAQAAPAPSRTPAPPAVMSKVGGDRLSLPGTQANTGAGIPALPKGLTARSWIVTDAETGEILAEHNAHWKLAPASTLKMLLADMLIPKLPQAESHKVAASDLKGMGEGSSLVGIKENLTYTVKDLWLGVFLRSGNDAVHVLSAMNGGVPATVADMNAEAHELQADDTHVVSPDGYDMPGQASSAYDLTLFARAGLQLPEFREYCSTPTAQFPGDYKKVAHPKKGQPSKTRESFQIQNTDRLLTGDYDLKPYQGIAGVKNGDTTNAGATYTGVAQRGGRKLLVTVMHPDPKSGHNAVYREAASLLDWGFKAAPSIQPVGSLVPPLSQVTAPEPSKQPAKTSARPVAAVTTSSSSSRGLWTAAGITAATLVVLAAVIIVVRRRRPLPSAVVPSGARLPAQHPQQAPDEATPPDQASSPAPSPRPDRRRRPRSLRRH
ncbi:D-alanyl-D-alanine carboxypeptidase (penicillin-binding protein 5/6) [Actinacidiphila yanglinensis]|uniref:D-alanyl-D-alanine carboxypeptidase (Penicillin-binding protein 5/6) n=1 Tax=Actinacidiphila yanglinensis TaxID=310779 RepID=A0A1H6BNA2_9ACTN|nr:D-alanyl-D-alanine carboxypeptidase [Actinacidiphila yanglinensis]SEG62150.1 D-alanyl-D-alanine carboxypeptidase (penicillin-binding protein 5/6) [Actinacidiphila yanglinensis]